MLLLLAFFLALRLDGCNEVGHVVRSGRGRRRWDEQVSGQRQEDLMVIALPVLNKRSLLFRIEFCPPFPILQRVVEVIAFGRNVVWTGWHGSLFSRALGPDRF